MPCLTEKKFKWGGAPIWSCQKDRGDRLHLRNGDTSRSCLARREREQGSECINKGGRKRERESQCHQSNLLVKTERDCQNVRRGCLCRPFIQSFAISQTERECRKTTAQCSYTTFKEKKERDGSRIKVKGTDESCSFENNYSDKLFGHFSQKGVFKTWAMTVFQQVAVCLYTTSTNIKNTF